MFERFTTNGIKVILCAHEESRRTRHKCCGSEHVLFGLLRVSGGEGLAFTALKDSGVTLKEARIEGEKIVANGLDIVAGIDIPFTPRSKRAIELSWDAAQILGHNYIGTEHLLLGLIREGECAAVQILRNLGLDLSELDQNVLKLIAERDKPTEPALGVGDRHYKTLGPPDNCDVCGKWSLNVNNVDHTEGPHICNECMVQLNEKMLKEEWYKNDLELRLAILQVLYWSRRRNPSKGSTDSLISDCLGLKGIFDIGPSLSSLRNSGYIKAGKPKFLLTDQGAKYLLEQLPVLKGLSER